MSYYRALTITKIASGEAVPSGAILWSNLVPRVSHLTSPLEMRDPGNKVVFGAVFLVT